MRNLYWLALAVLVALLAVAYAYARTHPSQPWDFYPPQAPGNQDELLYLNRV